MILHVKLLVPLLALLGSSHATLQRYCALFEAPSADLGETSNMTVSTTNSNVYVMVAHIADIQKNYLNRLDLDVPLTLPYKKYPSNKPMLLDPSTILHNVTQFASTNTAMYGPDSFTHQVNAEGIHCAFVYHKEELHSLEDIKFTAYHWSTSSSSSFTSHQSEKLMTAFLAVAILQVFVFPALIPPRRVHPYYRRQSFFSCLSVVFFTKMTLSGVRYFHAHRKGVSYTLLNNQWYFVDFTVSLLLVLVLYRLLVGFLSYGWPTAQPQDGTADKYIDRIFILSVGYGHLLFAGVFRKALTTPLWTALSQDLFAAILSLQSSFYVFYKRYITARPENNRVSHTRLSYVIGEAAKNLVDHICALVTLLPLLLIICFYDYTNNVKGLEVPRLGFFQDLRVAHTHVLHLDQWLEPYY